MTLYRVLSDEESRNVTRWQAPELGKDAVSVANTRQQANPQLPNGEANVRALLGSLDLKPDNSHISSLMTEKLGGTNGLANGSLKNATINGSLTTETQVVSAELLQASYDEGYKKGYAEGNIALQQKSLKELRNVISSLQCASSNLNDRKLENELVGMVMDIARFVIQHELSIRPEHIHNIVLAGLDQLPGESSKQLVTLHPQDASIVRECLSENTTLTVLEDISLSRGECHISSGASSLDAGVEDWLEIVARQLGLNTSSDEENL